MKMSNIHLDSPDKPPVLFVTLIVLGAFISVYVFWFFADGVLAIITNKMQSKIETGMGNTVRLRYVAEQESYLKSYKQLSDGHYKIPIDQAMIQVIQKDNQ